MSKNYSNCLYQLRCHIINNDSIKFTTNTFYNYLTTHYSTA